jgi:transcriptional regulator with XRE-family HTH domain
MSVSYIERDGQRFALVPAETYQKMLEDLEDLADVRAYDAAMAAGPHEYVPAEVVDRILAGGHPIRVWRQYRGVSATALASAIKIAPAYLSQLEHGHRQASHAVLRLLSTALQVDIDDLIAVPNPQSIEAAILNYTKAGDAQRLANTLDQHLAGMDSSTIRTERDRLAGLVRLDAPEVPEELLNLIERG